MKPHTLSPWSFKSVRITLVAIIVFFLVGAGPRAQEAVLKGAPEARGQEAVLKGLDN